MPGEATKLAVAALIRSFTDTLAARISRATDPIRDSDFDRSLAIGEIRDSIPRFRAEFTEATGVQLPLIGR